MLEPGDGATARTRVYTAGQVARALGVAETTLRSWHRRYRIGPHAATPGGYRRYSAEDVTRLQDMCDLIRSGMLASDAARTVSGKPSAESLRLLRDRLTAAGRRLDSRACLEIVAEAVRTLGVPATWDGLCCPVLREVESEQAARADDTACIPREHVLSWAITAALHQVTPTIPVGNLPTVMLACTDTEQHSLPLEALAAALAERRVPVRMLGAAVPTASLVDAVRAASPHVVVLWAQRRETASRQTLARLRRLPVRPLTAGPGWLPRRHGGVGHVDSLSAALASLADIIEGAEPVGSPGRP